MKEMEDSRKAKPLAVSAQMLRLLQPAEMGSRIIIAWDVHIRFLNPVTPIPLTLVLSSSSTHQQLVSCSAKYVRVVSHLLPSPHARQRGLDSPQAVQKQEGGCKPELLPLGNMDQWDPGG